jgi:hypothetical protein
MREFENEEFEVLIFASILPQFSALKGVEAKAYAQIEK